MIRKLRLFKSWDALILLDEQKIFMTRSPIEGDIKIKTKLDQIYLKDTESL